MKIIIQNRSNQPLYQQIKEQMKQAIMTGDLKGGERLPTIRALANDLHVSVLTTKKAYSELEEEGFITTRVGKGSFVAPENLDLLIESKRQMVEAKLSEACKMAHQLGIHSDELHEMLDLLFDEEDE
jgi:GntR family transcriptional regulator